MNRKSWTGCFSPRRRRARCGCDPGVDAGGVRRGARARQSARARTSTRHQPRRPAREATRTSAPGREQPVALGDELAELGPVGGVVEHDGDHVVGPRGEVRRPDRRQCGALLTGAAQGDDRDRAPVGDAQPVDGARRGAVPRRGRRSAAGPATAPLSRRPPRRTAGRGSASSATRATSRGSGSGRPRTMPANARRRLRQAAATAPPPQPHAGSCGPPGR